MIGPFVNGAGIAAGALIGAAASGRFPERIRTSLPLSFGVCALGLGVSLVMKLAVMPPVVLAVLVGSALGELLRIEQRLASLARLAGKASISMSGGGGQSEEFAERYVALIVLFTASGLGIFGAIDEGIGNGPTMLVTKAILDFFTAMIFAASLGPSVALICLPQMIVQFALLLGAGFLSPLLTSELSGNFSACGGLLMLATGLRIAGIKNFPIANMLPALLFVMPFTSLWLRFF